MGLRPRSGSDAHAGVQACRRAGVQDGICAVKRRIRDLSLVACLGMLLAPLAHSAASDESFMLNASPWTTLETLPPPIRNSAVVEAPLAQAWNAWTTVEGIVAFLGVKADVDLRPGGIYRVAFKTDAPTPREQGNDGRIIALEPMKMLSVTWMTPMHMQELSGNSTTLTLYFTAIDGGKRTQVDLINSGYGLGPRWHEAYDYNVRGWDRVLSVLEYRFETGPVDAQLRIDEMAKYKTMRFWREHKRRVRAATSAGAGSPNAPP